MEIIEHVIPIGYDQATGNSLAVLTENQTIKRLYNFEEDASVLANKYIMSPPEWLITEPSFFLCESRDKIHLVYTYKVPMNCKLHSFKAHWGITSDIPVEQQILRRVLNNV